MEKKRTFKTIDVGDLEAKTSNAQLDENVD